MTTDRFSTARCCWMFGLWRFARSMNVCRTIRLTSSRWGDSDSSGA